MERSEIKALWQCECNKRYKSELAIELCKHRKHTALPERLKEAETVIVTYVKKIFLCKECGATDERADGHKKLCDNCKQKKRRANRKLFKRKANELKPPRPLELPCERCTKMVPQSAMGRFNRYCYLCRQIIRNEYQKAYIAKKKGEAIQANIGN